jgi:hypothetical protein
MAGQAIEALSGLRAQWGDEAYHTYLSRPDMQKEFRQLTALVGPNRRIGE